MIRDRLVHHAIYRTLYPYFDRQFIFDSYSCRDNKGVHKAINRFRHFGRKVSKNNTRTTWVLKCDIRKFFASIDHKILKSILVQHIQDAKIMWLLGQVIDSFHTEGKISVGLPLGNLTSQLFVNVYMNEFDHFVKQKLNVQFYIRYADDFILFSTDKQYLEKLIPQIVEFLSTQLKLELHPNKLFLKTLALGVDFLGWVHFPKYRVLRTSTKRKMFRNVNLDSSPETCASYLGLLSHGNSYKLTQKLLAINGLDHFLDPKNMHQ